MTSADLLAYCRTRLDDLTGVNTTRLFPDSEIYGYISDCQETVASECHVIRDCSTVAVCSLTLLAGASMVAHSATVLGIDDVRYTRGDIKKRISLTSTDSIPLTVYSGDPVCCSISSNPGFLSFDSAPLSDATLTLLVRRMPINPVSSVNQLEIPDIYHRKLVNGVLAMAFVKPDTETYSVAKANTYFSLFEKDRESIKRMDIKLHGHGTRFVV